MIYEGGKPYPREDFDWDVALQGLIAPLKLLADLRGSKVYPLVTRAMKPAVSTHFHPDERWIRRF